MKGVKYLLKGFLYFFCTLFMVSIIVSLIGALFIGDDHEPEQKETEVTVAADTLVQKTEAQPHR